MSATDNRFRFGAPRRGRIDGRNDFSDLFDRKASMTNGAGARQQVHARVGAGLNTFTCRRLRRGRIRLSREKRNDVSRAALRSQEAYRTPALGAVRTI